VLHNRGWHMSESATDNTEDRMLDLNVAETGDAILRHGSGGGWRMPKEEPVAAKEARLGTVKACDEAGLVGIWEWSRTLGGKADEVPPEMWGLYGEEQDAAIEKVFRTGEPSVQIAIGIRTYEITFHGANGGKQEDKAMKKRRLVRRQNVTSENRKEALSAAAGETNADPGLADEECSICCDGFAETPSIPVVRLPGCGHCFHAPCIQHIADKRGPCPFCRAKVDWMEAMRPSGRTGSPVNAVLISAVPTPAIAAAPSRSEDPRYMSL